MITMKSKIFFAIVLFVLSQSCKSQEADKAVKIIPLTVLTETDTFNTNNRTTINRLEYFLVEGNIRDSVMLNKEIESFVKLTADKNRELFYAYEMTFYKSTKEITLKSIEEYPDIFWKKMSHIDDPRICTYFWIEGELMRIKKYKDGKEMD